MLDHMDTYNNESQYRFAETQSPTKSQRDAAYALARTRVNGTILDYARQWIYSRKITVAELRQLFKRWNEEMPMDYTPGH